MTCGHLFNGVGGFALAAHWMGWENVMHCEIDPFCNKVMNYHFPNSYQHEDIRITDFTIWRGKLDLITGGFPCQPYSTAGKRKGKEDDRHLWPQILRAIREIQLGWIVGENVRGLTNWNGGLVFDEVQSDLEAEGYEVLPFLLPAAGVGAPHRRDRIWFVAYASRNGYQRENGFGKDRCQEGTCKNEGHKRKRIRSDAGGDVATGVIADAASKRRLQSYKGSESNKLPYSEIPDWGRFPTQSPVCNGNDGLSNRLADWPVPSRKGIRILKGKQAYGRWRRESLKSLGNAIVPQVAFQIFKTIEQWQLTQP